MDKLGAAVILAMATFAGCAAAQECAAENEQCHGNMDVLKVSCCEGLECIVKDEFYGQCKPVGSPVPDGWVGSDEVEMMDEDMMDEEMLDEDMMGPMGAEEEEDEPEMELEQGLEDDPVVDVMKASPVDVKWSGVIAKDYIPNAEVPNKVKVMDLPNAGKTVLDRAECEQLCADTPPCNAASYYLDGSEFANKNCWLKNMEDTCWLPDDAIDDPNAILLLKKTAACDDVLADAKEAAGPLSDVLGPVSTAMGPVGLGNVDAGDDETPNATPSTTTPQAPVAGVTTSPPDSPDTSAGVSAYRGVFVVFAGLAAALL